jgi:hypothetical protein
MEIEEGSVYGAALLAMVTGAILPSWICAGPRFGNASFEPHPGEAASTTGHRFIKLCILPENVRVNKIFGGCFV